MKTLKEHKDELIKNLTTDGWKAVLEDFDYDTEVFCVKAQKRVALFFNRIHIYIVIEKVDSNTLKEIIELIKDKFFKYHAIWIAADTFTKEVKEYAKETQQLGLLEINIE